MADLSDTDRALIIEVAREVGRAIIDEIRSCRGGQLDFLSVQEAAKVLRVAEKTIHALIRRGDLKSHRVGRLVRIREVDLRACLAGRKQGEVELDQRCDEILSGQRPK